MVTGNPILIIVRYMQSCMDISNCFYFLVCIFPIDTHSLSRQQRIKTQEIILFWIDVYFVQSCKGKQVFCNTRHSALQYKIWTNLAIRTTARTHPKTHVPQNYSNRSNKTLCMQLTSSIIEPVLIQVAWIKSDGAGLCFLFNIPFLSPSASSI